MTKRWIWKKIMVSLKHSCGGNIEGRPSLQIFSVHNAKEKGFIVDYNSESNQIRCHL